MKQILFAVATAFTAASIASASPCVTASLASYVGLGSGGCTVGTNTFSGFTVLSGSLGATPISPAGITMTPSNDAFEPGLQAAVDVSASAGNLLEAFFTYQVTGSPYTRSAITLGGSAESGDGAVSYVQNFCAGGVFGPDGVTGCTGSPGSLVTLNGSQNQDSASLGPASFISVTDDFVIDGGLTGSASGGVITDRFSAAPEPSNFVFTGLGLAYALVLAWRALRLNSRMK